jgi:hypothetical protein
MLPLIVGPGTFTPSPFAPSVAERSLQGAQPSVGETAAAGTRPETPNRVAPPRVLPATPPLPEERRRGEPLLPPDPEPPTGPPPAFDATPLDRARETALDPPDRGDIRSPPDVRTGARADGDERIDATGDDGLLQKAETDLAEVRRMAMPDTGPAVDVVI